MNTSNIVALVAVAIIALAGWFLPVPGSAPSFGGTTNYDTLDVDTLVVGSASASSSATFGKACWEVTTNVGSTTYVSFIGTGTTVRMATSTTSCL